MASKLKVVALISGGKDSLFSQLHCLANGHEVVALANLHPAATGARRGAPHAGHEGCHDDDGEGEDLNSFMYQTVGHSIIPLYADALKLPLYRQPILGAAKITAKDYYAAPKAHSAASAPAAAAAVAAAADTSGEDRGVAGDSEQHEDEQEDEDETESLVPLLRKVLAAHPDANALSTGAILSTYQRTRVESVCLRLGLVPLGYLWQFPSLPPYRDAALLHDMAAVGQDARIIKVASGGIDDSFLWANVANARTVERLKRAAARFGGEGAVLGEGGEFETLAVDGPAVLWKGGRIEVNVDEDPVIGEGGSAFVRLRGARVVEKQDIRDDDELKNLRIPDLLDTEFEELARSLLTDRLSSGSTDGEVIKGESQSATVATPTNNSNKTLPTLQQYVVRNGTTLFISNLTSTKPSSDAPAVVEPTAQLHDITNQLRAILNQHAASPASITSTTLLLRSMSLFTTLNPIYGALFTTPNPPARITVACGDDVLQPGVDVTLSCMVELPDSTTADDSSNSGSGSSRRGLHVQSRSYWAPANIGPYSQAVAVPASSSSCSTEIVHLAGQIPLVSASMEMVRAADAPVFQAVAEGGEASELEFAAQTVLALQHLFRVGRAMGVAWWTCGVAFVSSSSSSSSSSSLTIVGGRRAETARKAWRGIHEQLCPKKTSDDDDDDDEDDVVDVWDLKYGVGRGGAAAAVETDARPALPDFSHVQPAPRSSSTTTAGGEEQAALIPPCIVAQVAELPRDADVEWTSPGFARLDGAAKVRVGRLESGGGLHVHETLVLPEGRTEPSVSFYAAGVREERDVRELDEVLGSCLGGSGRACTVYVAPSGGEVLPREWMQRWQPLVVPCRRVWGPEGAEVAAAVTVRGFAG